MIFFTKTNESGEIMSVNMYRKIRDDLDLSRETVSDLSYKYGFSISDDILTRIENGIRPIQPEEVLLLSKIYKNPILCNYHCSNECPIGKQYVPEIKLKELQAIALETVASLNTVEAKKNRLIDISVDGMIQPDEIKDFINIQNELERISITVETLQIWVEKMLADGSIDLKLYNKTKNEG